MSERQHVGYDQIREMAPRFIEALKASGFFWVEDYEYDSGLGMNLTVSDKQTGLYYTVMIEEEDEDD